ncbi:hypothetical protein jhhlp_005461 [Lomentospora prolificans]|uniref:Intradiol ring-cleavage dioxygenases domain-containing protein n=1 Tax=Lomentospora prolificans TaxID=41688 RepID=A0A2N3N6W8_9PEZI|nr:hypothetical protein jhhlp_005461 [Lomentospora prolificans]
MVAFSRFLGLTLLAGAAVGHPGSSDEGSMSYKQRRAFRTRARRSLNACSDTLHQDQTLKRAAVSRAELFQRHNKRGLTRRDTPTVLATDHSVQVDASVLENPESLDTALFQTETACIVMPEGEIGPFWVKGEHIRDDLIDDEAGVPVYLHAQFIDVNTCKPIPDLYWDVWNANSTGVYSGVQSSMNGNPSDAANLENAALRGIQKTDEDGIASFKTLFPGHYGGRCVHVHIVAHLNAELLPNNTLTGGSVPHIGQFFFDQGLVDEVEKVAPYKDNTAIVTTNAQDHVVNYETADSNSDPFFHYTLLGDTVEEGILAWITVGVDATLDHEAQCGAEVGEDGGKMCEITGNFGIPGGFGPPGGGFPPGGPGAPGRNILPRDEQ